MTVAVSAAYLAAAAAPDNTPNCVIEMDLGMGTRRWGWHAIYDSAVLPVLGEVSALENRIDVESGYATRGTLTFTLLGRDNWRALVAGTALLHARIRRKDGFVGLAYADYLTTYEGRIAEWERKGDELVFTASDLLKNTDIDIPTPNEAGTQYLDYRNSNPVDVMLDILQTRLSVPATDIDVSRFTAERDAWFTGWSYSRVITTPAPAGQYLAELQTETNSFIFFDGSKISFRAYAPPTPLNQPSTFALTDANNLIADGVVAQANYEDGYYNTVVVYHSGDGNGSDDPGAYAAASVYSDSSSVATWGRVKTKTIYAKWINPFTWSLAGALTGVVISHVSPRQTPGSGTIAYTSSSQELAYTPPGDAVGDAVSVDSAGSYDLYGASTSNWVRVIVTPGSLPSTNQSGGVTLTAINATIYAANLASHWLARSTPPPTKIQFELDGAVLAQNGTALGPGDHVRLTTDEIFDYGSTSWSDQMVLLTRVASDHERSRLACEGIKSGWRLTYGFISGTTAPDYDAASTSERLYGYIGSAANLVGASSVDGYYIW